MTLILAAIAVYVALVIAGHALDELADRHWRRPLSLNVTAGRYQTGGARPFRPNSAYGEYR